MGLGSGLGGYGVSRLHWGFEPRTVQLLASRYTDHTIPSERNWLAGLSSVTFEQKGRHEGRGALFMYAKYAVVYLTLILLTWRNGELLIIPAEQCHFRTKWPT